MLSHRWVLALLLVSLASLTPAAPPAAKPAPPTPADIARWVNELGDDSFRVREAASKKLWAAGEAAQAALEKATKSPDREVVRRARDILVKFRWGIFPDTPRPVLDLIHEYRSSELKSRGEIVRKLIDAGPIGCKTVARFAEMEQDALSRQLLAEQISEKLRQARPALLATESLGPLEPLLNVLVRLHVRAGDGSVESHLFEYVAYWTLRGKLAERIAEIEPLATRKGDESKGYARVLAFLHRARGDRKAAWRAAEKTGDNDLLRNLLQEAADWQELVRRPELLDTGMTRAERLGKRAAFLRLAGDDRGVEATLKELKEHAAKLPDNAPNRELYQCAKVLYLNGRPDEAAPLLLRQKDLQLRQEGDHLLVVFEALCTRYRFKEALALVDQVRDRGQEKDKLPALEIAQARIYHLLGEKEKARTLFKSCGDQIKSSARGSEWFLSLVEAEQRAGLEELALEHGALALDRWKDNAIPVGTREQKPTFRLLKSLFPNQAEQAWFWWSLLIREKTHAKSLDVVKEIAAILTGKADLKKLRQRIDADRERDADDRPGLLIALAESALMAHQRPLALAILKEADSEKSLLRLGDLLAENREWRQAADAYQGAWEKGKKRRPLPLFLHGWALTQAGREAEGKKVMEQSHWLPLADVEMRVAFRNELRRRGHSAASRRENELVLRLGQPGSHEINSAFRLASFYPEARKDALRAAMLQEQATLYCLNSGIYFIQFGTFARMPAYLGRLRARGYLEAGQRDRALREIAHVSSFLPGDTGLAIDLVPILERQGLKKQAATLYDAAHAFHEKLCRDYPQSAFLHNASAWLSACCRRDLDRALEHALQSVKLAPEAGNLDTLAEVYFQRGDRARALAAQKRAIELNPKRAYFRKQLKRIEAGDPKAERPPEIED